MQLKIEKMIYGGDGLARLPAEGGRSKTVFVPFVLDGEEVDATPTREKSGIIYARAEKVLRASTRRVEPGCKYFYECGGCNYQHTDYEHQLEIKKAVLRESLERTAKLNWPAEIHAHASPPWNYRNRTRMHVKSSGSSGSSFAVGYYRIGSHDLLPVESCPISSPLINRAITAVWEMGRAGRIPTATHEIEFFTNASDSEVLLKVYSAYEPEASAQRDLEQFAQFAKAYLPEMIGTVAFATGSSLFPWDSVAWSSGKTSLMYNTQRGRYRVQAGSFFQTNRFLTDELVGLVVDGRSGKLALDLYAGTGLFSVPLAQSFERVVAVEASTSSFEDLQTNSMSRVEPVLADTGDFLSRPALRPDYIVLDPPRTGLGEKITRQLGKISAPLLTYVSCDPATLSRDLRILIEFGYRVQAVHMVDLFPQTYHVESVVHLALD
jgi:23S rRNA (uracil1939-C5)-methyltransferase